MDKEEWQASLELQRMSRDDLDKVDFDLKKWRCQCKNCTRGTRIRDYGISPMFYWPAKKEWINLNQTWLYCGVHWKFLKRLLKSFTQEQIDLKILDYSRTPIEALTDVKFTRSDKLG